MQFKFRSITNILIFVISMVAWWYLCAFIRPELHYFLQQTAFLTDSLFFLGYARYPGGLSDYLSEFISQFFFFNTFGSFLIVLVALALGMIAANLIRRIAGDVELRLSIFAVFVLFSIVLQSDYHYPFYASVRLLVTFGLIWIYAALFSKMGKLWFLAAITLTILVFYLAGGAALFVFTTSLVLIHLRTTTKKTEFILLSLLLVISGILPYLAYRHVFLIDFSLVYTITHSKSPMILFYDAEFKLYALYALLPCSILIALIYQKLKHRTKQKPVAEGTIRKPGFSPFFRLAFQFVFIVSAAILILNFTFDKATKDRTLVSFYGASGDWENVIKTAKSIEEYDLYANVEFNKALANSGKLADDMFEYKQLAGSDGLFLDGLVTSDVLFLCSDQYFDLGFMNESLHWTFEAQTIFPNSPRLMKRLVLIYLINGNYSLAEKFLHSLDKNMLYRDWVKKYTGYLKDPSLISKDPELAWKRLCEPPEEFSTSSYRIKLVKLLETNPANKTAFDYLISSALLDGDLGTFESLLKDYKTLVKEPLPGAWDEALVLFYYMANKSPDVGDIRFSDAGKDQFIAFIKAMKPFGNDWQSAKKSLAKDFGTTYWYYLKCLSPKVTKAQIKKQKFDEE